jgi:hypothetical protein
VGEDNERHRVIFAPFSVDQQSTLQNALSHPPILRFSFKMRPSLAKLELGHNTLITLAARQLQ